MATEAVCCACTGRPVGYVRDGAKLKWVCASHARLYRDAGFIVIDKANR